jgi:orotidine-5'-phosphate decarboxylase
MCTLITAEGSFKGLVSVTVHESIHSWFQGILGTNESKYEWMDEGFCTYAQYEVLNYLYEKNVLNPLYRQLFDSITVSPYMGNDSIEPFLDYNDKHTILLGLTSNNGANDFQYSTNSDQDLFKKVLIKSQEWKNSNNLMYVVGATKASFLKDVRLIVPNSFLLIPGVGAQGGSLEDTFKNGVNDQIGILVNSSRSIIYAGNDKNFLKKSYLEAKKIQSKMCVLLNNIND